ncbi:MAG: AbgT family transporter, partial [Planctomycetes bacterium]|nr:AbgT family transporter [Planctomycetota bacterium]
MSRREGPAPPREPVRGWLGRIERVGNALPDPLTLFALGTALVFLGSWLGERAGWSCTVLDARGVERVEHARSLLSSDGLRWLATELVPIYVNFKPLGLVLCASIGVAVAEKSGFLAAALRAVLLYVPRALLTPATLLVGVCSSLASDAGFVVLPPLAAAVYRSFGRPAALGIATVTAGVAVGFGANPFLTSLDAVLAGMTEQSARLIEPAYVVNVACNWHFKVVSALLLVLVGWFVSERIVAPRLARTGLANGAGAPATELALPRSERRGLACAFAALLLLLALFVLNQQAEWGFLHDPPGAGSAAQPTWVRAIIALIVALFLIP